MKYLSILTIFIFLGKLHGFPPPKCTLMAENIMNETNAVLQTLVDDDSNPLMDITKVVIWYPPIIHPLFKYPTTYLVFSEMWLGDGRYLLSFNGSQIQSENRYTSNAKLGDWISSQTPTTFPSTNQFTPTSRFPIQGHTFQYSEIGVCWNPILISPTNLANTSKLWTGFRHPREDGSHHGWIELSKTNIDHWDYFVVSAWVEHPEPDVGIQVGYPAVPSLKSEITEAGLILRAGFRTNSMILEESWVLGDQEVWRVVGFTDGVSAPIPLAAKQRYYRLRIVP